MPDKDHDDQETKKGKPVREDVTSFEMDNEIFKWSFRNYPNAEAFRRSMLPFYLLKEDKDSEYPRYIEFSNLALNLCDKTSVKIKVILDQDIWHRL